MTSLPPGRYIVSASVGDVQSAELPGYAPSYYPGTPVPGQAVFVGVTLGQDLEDIDFSLSRGRTVRITGEVIDAAGTHSIAGSLRLTASQRAATIANAPAGARTQRDGRFEFSNVAAGQYVIQSDRGRANRWTEGEFGTIPVSVTDDDATGLILQTSVGSSIRGRVTFDTSDPSSRPSKDSVHLSPVPADYDLSPTQIAIANIHEDWTFDIAGVHGPRRLQAVQLPDEWALEEVRVHGVDVTDRALPFGRPNQSLTDVEVVLTDRPSELTGTVTDDHGKPAAAALVIVCSTDRDQWYPDSRFERAVRSGASGQFRLTGLPFGTYYVVAMRTAPDGGDEAWQDPEVLAGLILRASTLTIAGSEKRSVRLRTMEP
jgi:hypothetical protein